jgi:hypothetical protein
VGGVQGSVSVVGDSNDRIFEMFWLRWCGCLISFLAVFFTVNIVYGLRKYDRKELQNLRYVYRSY